MGEHQYLYNNGAPAEDGGRRGKRRTRKTGMRKWRRSRQGEGRRRKKKRRWLTVLSGSAADGLISST